MNYIGTVTYIQDGVREIRGFHGATAHEVITLIERKTVDKEVVKIKIRKVVE